MRLFIPADLRPLDNRMAVLKSIKEVNKRFPKGENSSALLFSEKEHYFCDV